MTNEAMLKVINDYMKDNDVIALIKAKQQLEEDVRAEIQKSKGNASKDKIIKAMFKKSNNPQFTTGYVKYENQFVFLDGYRTYILNDDMGYRQLDKTLDISSFKHHGDIEINVDTNDVKFYIKQCKAEGKDLIREPYIVQTDAFDIGFNAQYLLEFMQIFGEKMFAKNALSPIYAENDNGEWGVLLPIRIKKNK